jgi:putative cell wall-binding protein
MVQQPAREAMKKNKKRVQQLMGKEIHRPEIDKAKEKTFGCKLKKNRSFSISSHIKYRGQLLHKVQNLISNQHDNISHANQTTLLPI